MPPKNAISQKKKEDRAGIIEAVKTPLGLCALIVLAIEAILAGVALKLTDTNLTILVVGMIASLLLMILFVGYAVVKNPSLLTADKAGDAQPPTVAQKAVIKYDVFLSVPMAACSTEEDYRMLRDDGLKVIETLRTACGLKNVSYAARYIESLKDFDAADLSILDDLQAIKESRYFVMIYTSKIVSSCLVEAGYAVALRKPSLYFVRDKKHLPFLLQNAGQALDLVKIQEHDDVDGITKLISKHQLKLFPSSVE